MGLLHRYRHTHRVRHCLDHLWLASPWLGEVAKKIILARIARTLSTLLTTGLPLPDALALTAPVAANCHFEAAIEALQQDIATGQPLSLAMHRQPLFPPLLQQMVRAGEESASLINMFEKTAEFYESAADHAAGILGQCLEPLIMLTLGVLIGALVIAMYLPLFRLGNAL